MSLKNWKPQPERSVSLYQQIVDHIKSSILAGELSLGEKLPTQRELAEVWGVNRSTVVLAIDCLQSEGILESHGKGGTIVAQQSWSLFASGNHSNWSNYIHQGIQRPNQQMIQEINRYEFETGIIRLGTGELSPELFPTEMQSEILSRISKNVTSLNYEEPKGLLPLREEICKDLKRWGIEAQPEQVVIVSGALQALQLVSLSIMPQGSTVFVENPSYIQSLSIFQSAGMQLIPFEVGQGVKRIKNKLQPRKSNFIYTIPTFHNPTGVTASLEDRESLLAFSKLHRMPILEDDTYRELYLDEKPPMPIKAMDKEGHVLYMGTVSKSLAPGFRIGWVVGPTNAIERLADVKMQTDYGSSSLSQWAVYEWFRSGMYSAYMGELRSILRVRRDFTLSLMDLYFKDIATWEIPQGGFYIWLKLNSPVSQKALFNACYKKNILINPGAIYDAKDDCHIRLSYAYAKEEELGLGIKVLANLVKIQMKNQN